MPIYTIKNKKTNEEKEVVCSFSELQEMLSAMPDWAQTLTSPRTVSGIKDVRARTPDGFKDVLRRVKSGSAKNNTVNI